MLTNAHAHTEGSGHASVFTREKRQRMLNVEQSQQDQNRFFKEKNTVVGVPEQHCRRYGAP
jgi:hypothetical protein